MYSLSLIIAIITVCVWALRQRVSAVRPHPNVVSHDAFHIAQLAGANGYCSVSGEGR